MTGSRVLAESGIKTASGSADGYAARSESWVRITVECDSSTSGGAGIETYFEGGPPGASRLLATYAVPCVCGLYTYAHSPWYPRICSGVPGRANAKRLFAMFGSPRNDASLL